MGGQGEEGVAQETGLLDLGGDVGIGVLTKQLRGVDAGQQADKLLVDVQPAIPGNVIARDRGQPEVGHSVRER